MSVRVDVDIPLPGVLDFATNMDEVFMVLKFLDTAYDAVEPTTNPLTDEMVSDKQYDLIRQAAKKMFPLHPYWDEVSGSEYKKGPKFKLPHVMVGLEKVVGPTRDGEFFEWLAECKREIPNVDYAMSLKIDGTGVCLVIDKGKFVQGGLRPRNGYDSEDRTRNLRHVKGVPSQLPIPLTCCIRGEVYVTKEDFIEVNKELAASGKKTFVNERNYVPGSLRQDDPSVTAARRLRFLAHSVVGIQNPEQYFTTEIERAIWCSKVLGVPHVRTTPYKDPSSLKEIYDLEAMVPANDKLIDGIIVMVNDLEDQSQMGTHGGTVKGNPKGKIAWKLADVEKEGTVGSIKKQTGRTGKMAYIATLKDTLYFETAVNRVTLHNLAFVHENGIAVGTTGMIIKSGGIIPKWVRTIGDRDKYETDLICPTCKHPTQIIPGSEGKYNEWCVNRQCIAQLNRNLHHFLKTIGVLGIGLSTIGILTDKELVKKPGDFYRLNVPMLMDAGLSERESLLALAAINMIDNPSSEPDNGKLSQTIFAATQKKKVVPLWVLFASQGIEGAGKSAGAALMSAFGDFDKIRKASWEDLNEVDGIGDITAISIRAFFEENVAMLDDLLQFIEPETVDANGPLKGMTFVLSGSMDPYNKDELEREIVAKSGKVSTSVTKKMVSVDPNKPHAYLVAGPGSKGKTDKAKELGVAIIDPATLKSMIG